MNAQNEIATGWEMVHRTDSMALRETVGEMRPAKGKSIAIGIGVAVGTALTASLVALLVFHTPYWSLAPIGGGAIGLGMLAGRAVYGYQKHLVRREFPGMFPSSGGAQRKPTARPTESDYTGL